MSGEGGDSGEKATVQMWRLKVAMGPNASWGDWRYYESQDDLECDLFPAAVEAEANSDDHRRSSERRRRWFKSWWRHNGEDESTPNVKRIVAVDTLVDGVWVEVPWTIIPPSLQLGEPVTADSSPVSSAPPEGPHQ